jgi:putrescine aminotransferase
VFNLGHNPPDVLTAVREELDRSAPFILPENLNPHAGRLAKALVETAGPKFGVCFFCSSGSEANEAAIKTAIAATGRPRIAYADGGWHGTTLGALACMGRGIYREKFAATLPHFVEVPFGDASALNRALVAGDIAAFLLEPVQMESGGRIASTEYLRQVQDICRQHGTILILDEVQTGMGRTGRVFAFQSAGVEPDIFTLAKSLGGGVVPIGAAVVADKVWHEAFGTYNRCEIHNTSFSGTSIGCAAAIRSLELISNPAFLENVRGRGNDLFGELRDRLGDSAAVEKINNLGLMGGITLRPVRHPWLQWENLGVPELAGYQTAGALVVERLWRKHILTQICAHDWLTVRIEPPLIVDEPACRRFVDAICGAIDWLTDQDSA